MYVTCIVDLYCHISSTDLSMISRTLDVTIMCLSKFIIAVSTETSLSTTHSSKWETLNNAIPKIMVKWETLSTMKKVMVNWETLKHNERNNGQMGNPKHNERNNGQMGNPKTQ